MLPVRADFTWTIWIVANIQVTVATRPAERNQVMRIQLKRRVKVVRPDMVDLKISFRRLRATGSAVRIRIEVFPSHRWPLRRPHCGSFRITVAVPVRWRWSLASVRPAVPDGRDDYCDGDGGAHGLPY